MSWSLVKGAEFTGKAIQKGASKLRERIQPEEKPVEVSPTVTRGLHIAKQATGGAAKVSQFLGKDFGRLYFFLVKLKMISSSRLICTHM